MTITLTLTEMLLGGLVLGLVGGIIATWTSRIVAARQRDDFDRYRGAMLDDWRYASDKVARMRSIVRDARSLAEIRDRLRMDDETFPVAQVGATVKRG